MTNVYQAPSSDLTESTVPYNGNGSIENGIAGNYEFSIRAIISEAWDKTSGSKGTFWLAALLYCLVVFPVSFGLEFGLRAVGIGYTPGDPISKMVVFMIISQTIQLIVSMPLAMGLFMIAVKRATGAPAEATDVFAYFPKTMPLFVTALLMYLFIAIGLCLLVLPGIYLMVAYCLAMPLIVEKNLSPWDALEASRKAVTHRWFRFVGLYIVMLVIMIVAAIPLGIGLIWVMPMFMLAAGIVYRNIFGYEGAVVPG